jgi:hypothetical protein
MSMPPDPFAPPWHAAEHNGRVSIVAASGRRVLDVMPGQWHSRPGVSPLATLEERRILAERICAAVNARHAAAPRPGSAR